jgi:LysM repeat protein
MDKVEETPAGAVDKPEKNTDDVMDIKDESLPEDTLDNNDKSTDNETSAPLDDIKDSSKDEEIPDIDDSGDSVKDILDDGSSTPATAPSQTHKLTSDTTLDQVASQYGITTEELKKANPDLPASGELKSGTEIKIP